MSGREAGQRWLAEKDRAWADWNKRIAAARSPQLQITADTQLSEPKSRIQVETDPTNRFLGMELIRAKGLVVN